MLNPSRYRIIAIGKVRKTWIQEGINQYLHRIPGLAIHEIRNNNLKRETEAILFSLKKEELIVVLGEEFNTISTEDFANKLNSINNQRIAFVIGGSDGISSKIKDIASWKLSLSPLTFPHELSRLLLIEQIYRAQTIFQGSPYHRI